MTESLLPSAGAAPGRLRERGGPQPRTQRIGLGFWAAHRSIALHQRILTDCNQSELQALILNTILKIFNTRGGLAGSSVGQGSCVGQEGFSRIYSLWIWNKCSFCLFHLTKDRSSWTQRLQKWTIHYRPAIPEQSSTSWFRGAARRFKPPWKL